MEAEEGVAITVFFDEGLSDEEIKDIGGDIEDIEQVATVTFVSAEEAWEAFKEDYFAENESLAEGFEEDNPLANSANYQVTMKDVAAQSEVCEIISQMEGVRKINSSQSLADTLIGFSSFFSEQYNCDKIYLVKYGFLYLSHPIYINKI